MARIVPSSLREYHKVKLSIISRLVQTCIPSKAAESVQKLEYKLIEPKPAESTASATPYVKNMSTPRVEVSCIKASNLACFSTPS